MSDATSSDGLGSTDVRVTDDSVIAIVFPNQARRNRWWTLIRQINDQMEHLRTTNLHEASLTTKRAALDSWFTLVFTLREEFGVDAVPLDIRQACNDNEEFCDLPPTTWTD